MPDTASISAWEHNSFGKEEDTEFAIKLLFEAEYRDSQVWKFRNIPINMATSPSKRKIKPK